MNISEKVEELLKDCLPGLTDMERCQLKEFYDMRQNGKVAEIEELYVTTFDSSQIRKTVECMNDAEDFLKKGERNVNIVLNLKSSILTREFSCDKVKERKEGRMMNIMPVSEVIDKVAAICKKNGVRRLDLFGSFATGTALPTSDIDFVVYGCEDICKLEKALEEIDTLRKIDIFDFDSISNEYLLEDIKKYGKPIY